MAENSILGRIGNFLGFGTFREQDIEQFSHDEGVKSFAPPANDDGAIVSEVSGSQFVLPYQDAPEIKNTKNLIDTYRKTSLIPEVDRGIEDIVNQSIVPTADGGDIVDLMLSDTDFSDKVKEKIQTEFDYILRLHNFSNKAEEDFRNWYIDSRLVFHKMIDEKKPELGIQELRKLDPRFIEKLRIVRKETQNGVDVVVGYDDFFVYRPTTDDNKMYVGTSPGQDIKMPVGSVVFAHSGLKDETGKNIIGYLHQAIRPANQIRMLEDAAVIYRISRAPERRVFYIDVGNLPKSKAEQYMNNIMTRFKNKIVYDSKTGSVKNRYDAQSILEDYWLPRKDGSKGTEIDTLQGGQAQGLQDELKYFKKNLYESMRVPASRFDEDQDSTFDLGKPTEVTRDEMRFARFISKLQSKFGLILLDPLKSQLLLKNIITNEDWEKNKSKIRLAFNTDTYFEELKESEILQARVDLVSSMEDMIGKYVSNDYIMRHVLKQSTEDMQEQAKLIEEEKKDERFREDDGF